MLLHLSDCVNKNKEKIVGRILNGRYNDESINFTTALGVKRPKCEIIVQHNNNYNVMNCDEYAFHRWGLHLI